MKRGRENRYLPPYEKRHDSAGVYRISMPTVSKLVYIGSAAQTIRHRWRQHVCDLLAERHGNPLLQRAVKKYGIEHLRFEIVEICAAGEALQREQEWIHRYEWDDLFNLNPSASSRLGAKLSEEDRLRLAESHGGISSPDVLREIAKEYLDGASQSSLAAKYNVNRSSIRNYLARLGVKMRPNAADNHETVAEVRRLYKLGNSSGYCAREVGIDQATVIRILTEHGEMRSVSEAQKERAKKLDRREYAKAAGAHTHVFKHPKHGTFNGYQFEFRAKFGLNETLVSQLCRGMRKSLDGWVLEGPPKKASRETRSGQVFHFIHPKHGEFVGRQNELLEKFYGLNQSGISGVVCGRSVSYKGWELRREGEVHVFRGGSTNTRTGLPRNRRRKVLLADHEKIRRAVSSGVRQSEVAKTYKVSPGCISRICRAGMPKTRRPFLSPEERANIIRKLNIGLSQASIASEFGVTQSAISKIRKKSA